jgi:DNA processing protein
VSEAPFLNESKKSALFLRHILSERKLLALWESCGTFEKAWNAGAEDLKKAGFDKSEVEGFFRKRESLNLREVLKELEENECSLLTLEEDDYPELLREISLPPPVLFFKGKPVKDYFFLVGIVGTRKPTAYGRSLARELGRELSRAGVGVVSGLARGVDKEAHYGALEGEGKTIAVLGCGVDIIYPFHNAKLYKLISEEGTILSEFPLGTSPHSFNFPQRNRIISGLSRGVVVVEAGERSGALITAHFALEQNREVFALPGSVRSKMSKGPHRLIKEGACLVEDAFDILQEFGVEVKIERAEEKVSDGENRILSALEFEPRRIDEIAQISKMSVPEVLSCLTLLELKGKVAQDFGEKYYRLS